MKTLTDRQRRVLFAVNDHVEGHGYGPTVREISDAVGLSSMSATTHHLANLERKGLLTHVAGQPRTLRLAAALVDSLKGITASGTPVEHCSECGCDMPVNHERHVDMGEVLRRHLQAEAEAVEPSPNADARIRARTERSTT